MNYYSIFIVLVIAVITYSAFKAFSKPTVIDCGDYKVQSKKQKRTTDSKHGSVLSF